MVTLRPEAALDLPLAQQQFLTVEVQPNSLVNNGQHVASGQVGISVVPPELVRDMLPPGLLQHTFDITVRAQEQSPDPFRTCLIEAPRACRYFPVK